MPYDWRKPSRSRRKRELWSPDSRKFLVPKSHGWGYGLNFGAFKGRRKKRS